MGAEKAPHTVDAQRGPGPASVPRAERRTGACTPSKVELNAPGYSRAKQKGAEKIPKMAYRRKRQESTKPGKDRCSPFGIQLSRCA